MSARDALAAALDEADFIFEPSHLPELPDAILAALDAAGYTVAPKTLLDVADAARAFRDGTYPDGRPFRGGDLVEALRRLEEAR